MNSKIAVVVICAEAIKYLLLYNFHDCTFNHERKKKNIKRFSFEKEESVFLLHYLSPQAKWDGYSRLISVRLKF